VCSSGGGPGVGHRGRTGRRWKYPNPCRLNRGGRDDVDALPHILMQAFPGVDIVQHVRTSVGMVNRGYVRDGMGIENIRYKQDKILHYKTKGQAAAWTDGK